MSMYEITYDHWTTLYGSPFQIPEVATFTWDVIDGQIANATVTMFDTVIQGADDDDDFSDWVDGVAYGYAGSFNGVTDFQLVHNWIADTKQDTVKFWYDEYGTGAYIGIEGSIAPVPLIDGGLMLGSALIVSALAMWVARKQA